MQILRLSKELKLEAITLLSPIVIQQFLGNPGVKNS